MQPIGDSSTDVANLLGGIAKCGARAPLDVVSWNLMPDTNLEIMWKHVQHKTDAPEEFKENCFKLISGHWKKWKSRVKSNFFIPNKDDPEKLTNPPTDTRVNPDQWSSLVAYWPREDVKAQSIRNANNRKQLEFLPRTGRTSHANIREEMKANNEDISRANVFIKTRSKTDGTIPDDDTRMVVDRIKDKLNEVPQSEQIDSFKEKVFTDLMGSDGHGRVRTFGFGPSPRDVFGAHLPSKNTTSSDAIKMMVQSQVDEQLEARVAERVSQQVAEKVEMKKQMDVMQRLLEFAGLLPQSQSHETTNEAHTTSNDS